jgi:hypothetical protein
MHDNVPAFTRFEYRDNFFILDDNFNVALTYYSGH